MIGTINTWLIRVFCIFWALFLFMDYASNSGYLTQAFTYFEYTGLLVTAAIISAGLVYMFSKRKKTGFVLEVKNYRNIYSYLFLLMFMGMIMLFYVNQTDITQAKGSAVILFLVKVFGFHLAILPVLAAAFSTGSFLIEKSGIRLHESGGFFVSLALGFAAIVLGLFILGASGLLKQWAVLLFILLLVIPGRKNLLPFIKKNLIGKVPAFEIHAVAIIPFGLVLFLMALNFCYTTRPFPIGFDDINLYMNIPKLIAGYGALTQGGDAYNWSLMMSVGFIAYKSAAISMLLSFLPGVLSIMVVYLIARRASVSREWSLFACSLFYTLPNIIWQSRNDAKVDLALLFITLCGVLLLMEFYFSALKQSSTKKIAGRNISSEITVWVLCGLLVGFAFGIKYTSLLSIFAFLVFIFYITAGKKAAAGMFFLNFAIIFGLKLTRFAAFDTGSVFLTIVPLVLSLIFFALAMKENRGPLITSSVTAIVFCACIGLTFIPWAVKNISENKTVSFQSVLTGKSPQPVLYPEMKAETTGYNPKENIELKGGREESSVLAAVNPFQFFSSSVKLIADGSGPADGKTAKPAEKRDSKYTDKYEEIRRYLGYEKGFIRFISLPYDLAMKTNVRLWSADTGILLLIILPVLMLVYNDRQLVYNILKMILMVFLLIASILSVSMHAGPFELDKALMLVKTTAFADSETFRAMFLPLYLFMKKLLLMSGNLLMPIYNILTFQTVGFSFMLVIFSSFLIYYLYKKTMESSSMQIKTLTAFTFCVLMCWMILSSGIFWYGVAGFALLTVVLAAFAFRQASSGNPESRFTTAFIVTCTALWFFLILPFQFMPIKFTLVVDMTQVDFKGFIDRPFAKYAIGASSEKDVFRQFFQPAEQRIIQTLNSDKNAGVLNVSTFLSYHITNNDRRVYVDNQLGIFDKAYRISNGDKKEVLNELKRKGIKYILVSLYTPTLDMTPEKSLTKKYTNMMTLLVNNPGARLLATNRVVERPDGNMPWTVDGKQVRAMYHLAGMRMLNQGSVAMFELL